MSNPASRRAVHTLPEPPEPNARLDWEAAKSLPDRPGIYAAWILEEDALEAVGVEGPAPVLTYVGKAGSLRERIGRHVPGPQLLHRLPFIDLGELLALRGAVISNWWARSFDKGPNKYWNTPSALGALGIDQTLSWQRDHLVWGWTPIPKGGLSQLEARLINTHAPLLNRRGQGLSHHPPQLRRIGPYEETRALWLYLLSFTAATRTTFERSPWGADEELSVGLDAEGFPCLEGGDLPLEDSSVLVPGFDEATVLAEMREAVADGPADVRAALSVPPRRCELLNWWAAASALGGEGAMAGMLTGREEAWSTDEDHDDTDVLRLPKSPERIRELVEVIELGLGYERH